LDRRLWTFVARQRIGDAGVDTLRYRTILRNAARHSWLMVD